MLNLRILNVGEGDLTIKFDKNNKAESDRAGKIVGDLLRQGYAVMVEVGSNDKGPIYQRATGFDAETSEYLVMGDPPGDKLALYAVPESSDAPAVAKSKRTKRARYPASAPSVAIARTAGGYNPVLPSRVRRGCDPSKVSI